MSDDELVFIRTVSGPRPFVFACMTEPRHLAAFWGPTGTTTPLDGIVVDLRPGGRFETLIVNDSDGSTHHMRALFDAIDPPRTVSWTDIDSGMATTVTFTDTDPSRTEIRIHQRHVPDALRGPDAQTGFRSSLDRFERYLTATDPASANRVPHRPTGPAMDLHPLIGDTFAHLADRLEQQDPHEWDQPSLCAGWRVRDVISHVTMPARLTNEQFGAELAAVGGDFQLLSDTLAVRDSELSVAEHLTHLRSPRLAAWEPPGGGAIGALNHAVVHGLDVTNALGLPRACTDETAHIILDSLTTGGVAARFDVDLSTVRLKATDLDWSYGHGRDVVAPAAHIISLACHRTLPNGQTLS